MTTAATIARCVQHCAQARDWRGRWRERDATMAHLIDRGTTQTIARETANAAANLGAWIHERADEVARELELCALWDAAA